MNQSDVDKYLDKLIEDVEDDITLVFILRTKEIKSRLAAMYEQFDETNELSRTQYYNSIRYQQELQHMEREISAEYEKLYQEILELLQATYLENYLRSGFIYEMAAQTPMFYTIPSVATINVAIENPINELKLDNILTDQRNDLLRNMRLEIAQGIQAGESYGQIAKRIEHLFKGQRGNPISRAMTTARTEAGRVQTESRLESMEHARKYADIGKAWDATLDEDTRSTHRQLDGQKADDDGYFHYKGRKALGPHLWGVASMDINCRCAVVGLVNGEYPELRRSRSYDDPDYQRNLARLIDKYMSEGMTEKQATRKAKKQIKPPNLVIPYRTYGEWYKTLLNNR